MGEVDPNILKNVPRNSTFNFYQREFWEEVQPSGHLIFTVFCLTVPMLILNILTAFAIKVCLIQYSASPLVCSCSCLRTWTWFSEMPRSTNWRPRLTMSLSWNRASSQSKKASLYSLHSLLLFFAGSLIWTLMQWSPSDQEFMLSPTKSLTRNSSLSGKKYFSTLHRGYKWSSIKINFIIQFFLYKYLHITVILYYYNHCWNTNTSRY